jgi:hypothetical protein
VPSGGLAQDLRAEADAQRRDAAVDRLAHQRPGRLQERRVVVRHDAAAHDDEPVGAVQVGHGVVLVDEGERRPAR